MQPLTSTEYIGAMMQQVYFFVFPLEAAIEVERDKRKMETTNMMEKGCLFNSTMKPMGDTCVFFKSNQSVNQIKSVNQYILTGRLISYNPNVLINNFPFIRYGSA